MHDLVVRVHRDIRSRSVWVPRSLFDSGSFSLRPAAADTLQKVAVLLKSYRHQHGWDRRSHRRVGRLRGESGALGESPHAVKSGWRLRAACRPIASRPAATARPSRRRPTTRRRGVRRIWRVEIRIQKRATQSALDRTFLRESLSRTRRCRLPVKHSDSPKPSKQAHFAPLRRTPAFHGETFPRRGPTPDAIRAPNGHCADGREKPSLQIHVAQSRGSSVAPIRNWSNSGRVVQRGVQ